MTGNIEFLENRRKELELFFHNLISSVIVFNHGKLFEFIFKNIDK